MKHLRKETVTTIEAAISAIEDDITDAQQWFAERSEAWQDSDKGQDYQAWLERLEEALDHLREIPETPES